MRITAACPEALIDDANQLAMVLGQGPADALTYGEPKWQDADGNLYAAASFVVRPEWVGGAQSALQRPEWDAEPYKVNMAGAQRAQAALVFSLAPVLATPSALTAIGGMDGREAIAAMGLVPKQEVVEEETDGMDIF